MNKIISEHEKDEQKLPKDQDHVLETKYNGEIQNLDKPNMEECEPEKEGGKVTNVSKAFKIVSQYGTRTSKYSTKPFNTLIFREICHFKDFS